MEITVDSKTVFVVYKKFIFFVLRKLKQGCFLEIHGSRIVDFSFEYYKGSAIAGNDVSEKVIRLLCELNILEPIKCSATTSQLAFAGLSVNKQYYKEATSSFQKARCYETHFGFRVNEKKLLKAVDVINKKKKK